jgi:putative flippase GtrA
MKARNKNIIIIPFVILIGILLTWLLTSVFDIWLVASIIVSVLVIIDIGYILNNYWHFITRIPYKIYQFIKYLYKQDIIKFAVVGSIGVGFNFSFLYLMVTVGGYHYLLSAAIAAIFTTVINYTLNHFWTFKKTKINDNWFVGWLRYKLVDDFTILIYLGELALFVELFGMWYIAGAILATIINYPIRFLIIRKLVWQLRKHNQTDNTYEWESYYNGNIVQMWWKREIANTVWEWIPSDTKLLNIGCGSSPISLNYTNMVGIDTNESKLEFMRSKHPKGTYTTQNTKDFADGSFDGVLLIEVIEHLDNPIEMVAEISRLLKVGGKAVIATPDYNKMLWRLAEQFTPYKEEHCSNFNMDKLDSLCQKYNLYPAKYKYVAGCDLIELFVKG